ncbi:hypothetical protein FDP51_06410 [Enterococcus mundtii]|uniref:hypothetical protein n=1 Tax=Enterococcus TaxID=1350 RepID=UPI00129C6C8D|nr:MULTISPECIES: hypothetical protein [Enterococcus]MRI73648.1 hypothetical protein [Enterococcus mundtii]HAP3802650.1 hypothetical protein [Enterococcus faecalis]HAP3805360.1 hypothetical protein [Enterococcus faecalis]
MEQRIYTNFSGKNFTQIRNEAVRDKELSWKARGILVYLASLPPDWKIYKSEVMTHSKDKKDSFNSGWKELIRGGYIRGYNNRNRGKFSGYTWVVTDDPIRGISESDFPDSDKSQYGKSATTNTYNTNTNNTNIFDTIIDTDGILTSYNKEFLTEKTVRLFLLFGTFVEAKEFLDIIFIAKKTVEKRVSQSKKSIKIYGEIWSNEIEKKATNFILKMKEAEYKGEPIKNLKAYWNKMMINFWENVYCMEREYGFTQLDYWHSNGNLELEDMFFEMKSNYSSKQSLEEDRRSFIYDN